MIGARLTALYRRVLPFPAAGAGVPGFAHAEPRRTVIDLSDLTRSARKAVLADRRERRTADLIADIAAGRAVTMRPRAEVVADITTKKEPAR